MSRQIILDTETTGMDPKTGDRIVEIGAVELINRELTGNHYHVYINPERDMPLGAFNVHGLSEEFLSDKALFADIAEEFLTYVAGAELVIHNATFDMNFLDHELKRLNKPTLTSQCPVIDTLALARDLYPGQRNSLDALCRRLGIDNTKRVLHGALLDSELLARVYLAMTGGQEALFASVDEQMPHDHAVNTLSTQALIPETPTKATRILYANEAELAAHQQFIAKLSL